MEGDRGGRRVLLAGSTGGRVVSGEPKTPVKARDWWESRSAHVVASHVFLRLEYRRKLSEARKKS